jgi:hypothetical protein
MTLPLAAAFLLAFYAALAGLSWLRLLVGERPARRKGMTLNLLRRAGPPAAGGAAVLVASRILTAPGAGLAAAILIAGGLAWGADRGLAEAGLGGWRNRGFRLLVASGLALGALWLAGLAAA